MKTATIGALLLLCMSGCAITNKDLVEVRPCDTPAGYQGCTPCPGGYEYRRATDPMAPAFCQRIGSMPYYYPGTPPKDCKVNGGYCYQHVIIGDEEYTNVYTWTPKYGWVFYYYEISKRP